MTSERCGCRGFVVATSAAPPSVPNSSNSDYIEITERKKVGFFFLPSMGAKVSQMHPFTTKNYIHESQICLIRCSWEIARLQAAV